MAILRTALQRDLKLFDTLPRQLHDRGTVTSERIQRRVERLLDKARLRRFLGEGSKKKVYL